jgi:SAM-dependent methyltransferase
VQFVAAVDVTPPQSGYVSYYDAKGEKFDLADQSCWQDKQKAVAKIIDSEKPDTMLDIGANTGWFSILAARRGIKVIATDVDESSIDTLYLYSKQNHLQILPLLISFNNMTRQIVGVDCSDSEYNDRNFKSAPLYLPATERLKSDMVLCLGLLHHLVLGEGLSWADVLGILSELTKKTLVLEYVDLQDKLIQGEPSFFKNIGKYSVNTYNIEAVMGATNRYFNSCEVLDSHPETRKLLICRK